MAWSSSDRRARLPDDWGVRRRKVIEVAGGVCEHAGCTNVATDVDHVAPGGNHSFSNLQALCSTHHSLKSSKEGHEALRALRSLTKREPERHPGALPEGQQEPRGRKGW